MVEGVTRGHSGENPRVRGADVIEEAAARLGLGEPPRARGRPRPNLGDRVVIGRTPACAGPTHPRPAADPRRAENPRVRGAYDTGDAKSKRHAGEPPRARGLLGHDHRDGPVVGRTPACAGPTFPTPTPRRPPAENPRVRGAYVSDTLAYDSAVGRTPACAGPTVEEAAAGQQAAENPRVRGAYGPGRGERGVYEGEPPRARGLRHRRC